MDGNAENIQAQGSPKEMGRTDKRGLNAKGGPLEIFLSCFGALIILAAIVMYGNSESLQTAIDFFNPPTAEQRLARAEQEKALAILADQEERYGRKPVNSAWDGSVREVKEYLVSAANDPDSLQYSGWTKVALNEGCGWQVRCKFRAKNMFGGYVPYDAWFCIQDGQVTSMTGL